MNGVNVAKSISELLYQFDCVIIPDFGGFVTNYAGAKIQPIQNTFKPPSKQISFNRNLTSNDGLLANFISETNGISFVEARNAIDTFVSSSVNALSKGEKVTLEKVGVLFLDPEKKVQFLPSNAVNYLVDSFGMTSFKATPISRPAARERIEKEFKERLVVVKAPSEEENKKRFGFYWAAAASLLVFMGIGYTSYKYQLNNDSPVTYASIGLDFIQPTYYPSAIKSISDISFEGEEVSNDTYVWKNEDGTSRTFVAELNGIAKKETSIESNKLLKFHVVGGCFSNEANATKLVKNLQKKGFAAKMVGTFKNLYTVSYESFATREEAVVLLDEVKNTVNSAAWLLEK
mgnify:CR=1 FL=1|tara:strand:- start:157 stop:1194 length:1038 start_codon:yes stop_codon:yes gene_type:complete